MRSGRGFLSYIKIYAKMLLFVCIPFWIIGAVCFYHISFCHTYVHTSYILRSISQPMYYILCSKESLKQTVWLPIMLFPVAVFLFHWMQKKLKERLPGEAEEVKVTETKITDDELDPDQVDFTKDI